MLSTHRDVEKHEAEEDQFNEEGEKEIIIDFAPADDSWTRETDKTLIRRETSLNTSVKGLVITDYFYSGGRTSPISFYNTHIFWSRRLY